MPVRLFLLRRAGAQALPSLRLGNPCRLAIRHWRVFQRAACSQAAQVCQTVLGLASVLFRVHLPQALSTRRLLPALPVPTSPCPSRTVDAAGKLGNAALSSLHHHGIMMSALHPAPELELLTFLSDSNSSAGAVRLQALVTMTVAISPAPLGQIFSPQPERCLQVRQRTSGPLIEHC